VRTLEASQSLKGKVVRQDLKFRIISTHNISPIIPISIPIYFATNTDFVAKTVSQVVQKAITSKQTTTQKRKRVTNKGGQCELMKRP